MSQPYPPGGGPPPDQPPYGQQPQQPYGQQYPQQPQYPQQQPPYGQPQGAPPGYGYPQQQPYAAPVPAPVVEADSFERSLSLMSYLWVALGIGLSGASVLEFRNFGGFEFIINVGALTILLFPFAASAAAGESQFVRFHAKQALVIGVAYLIARFVAGLIYLIPDPRTATILGTLLVGAVQVVFAYIAITAGVRAFFRRELYRAPIVGGMVR